MSFDASEYPAVTVLCPELPPYPNIDAESPSDADEAAALAYLCVFQANASEKGMRAKHASWTAALRAAALSPALWADCTSAQRKAEWESDKQSVGERWVREIDWSNVFKDADAALYARVFGGDGAFCAHCRARSTSGGGALLRCTTCRAVVYCSVECQKHAYWHHRRARNYDGQHVGCQKK